MTSSPIKAVGDGESDVWTGDSPRNTKQSIRTIRKSVEQQLHQLAQTGETHKLITLLEEGAPFVVDMVSVLDLSELINVNSLSKNLTKEVASYAVFPSL